MTCPNCNASNPAGTRFCLECGTRLGEQCQSCGAARVGEAKFCGECGTPFATAGLAASTGTASFGGDSAPVAERRLVSILFADLVGFTPFAEERDSEDVRETLTRYFDLASEVITRYGGTVEKFIGDAVMAVWGAPTAQEDDAERSVRAAIELVDAVGLLGPGIQARAGVLTGEAAVTLAATNQGMVAGDLVNTAARLQSAATPGTVLVGESTMHAASAAIMFEPVGLQDLKGKSDPIPAWRAVRVVAERRGQGRSDMLEAPFVGRADELRLLKELFHSTGREGRTRLVTVMGPAGIGKSRLGWEFFKYIDGVLEPVWWHTGRSPSYGDGITFWALGEMVRRRAGLAADDDEATTRVRIAETVAEQVPDEGERRWIEPALLALLGIGAQTAGSEQLFGAWRTFFERMAETGTVALVFEDLHWADSGTLEFIEHLLEWSRNSPIFIVTLARPELLDRRPDWGAGKRNFTSLYLDPLSEPAMRELLAGLVPGLPENAISSIVARADGIPLYAVETVRTLIAEGRLAMEGERYVPAGDLTTFAVPETLHALIAARLDGLPAAERTLVTHAAVLGQSFTIAGLAAVSGNSPEGLEPLVQDLVRRELLVHIADVRSPERGQYAFVQGLIREVAYAMLAKRDRKTRHLAAARHFETFPTDEMSGALAVHYVAAHANASEGPESSALAAQARIALRAAAERATALGAHAQTVSYLRQALPLTTDPAEEAQLLEQAAEAASRSGHHEEAATLAQAALEGSREGGDRAAIARATTTFATVLLEGRQVERALALLLPAAAEYDEMREPGAAGLHGQLARAQFMRDENATAVAAAERVLEVAELLDLDEVLADTLITKGSVLTNLGRSHEGLGLLTAGLELARASGFAKTELRATVNIAVHIGMRDPKEALRLSRAGLELAQRMGTRDHLLAANASEMARAVGEWDWAESTIAEYLATDPEGMDKLYLVAARLMMKMVRGEEEDGDIDELDRVAAEVGDPAALAVVGNYTPEFALWEGRLADARTSAELRAAHDRLNAAPLLVMATHAAVWERDLESLVRIHGMLAELGNRGRYGGATEKGLEAAIAGLEGRRAESLAAFRHVASELKELGVLLDVAFNAIDMGSVLGVAEAEVRAELEGARVIGEGLRARPVIDRVDALLQPSTSDATARSTATRPLEVEAAS